MSAASYEQHQVEQIQSILNDQRECITLRSIMLELTVHRSVARAILEEIANQCSDANGVDNKYQVVRMISRRDGGGKNRMELVSSSDGACDQGGACGRVFSIALVVPSDDDEGEDAEMMDEDNVDENGNPIVSSNNNNNLPFCFQRV